MPEDVRRAADDQRRLVAALRDPAVHGAGVARVDLIETHISDVLLTGTFAYKLRKPVDLGFVDFTTLELRRRFCEQELALNRRLAPELYLDVVAITGTPDRPVLGGDGPAIEYAVKMREFPQDALASRALERGELGTAEVDALAAIVAAFHGRVGVAPPDGAFGAPAEVLRAALDNFAQLDPLCDDPGERAELRALRDWTVAEHARRADAFARRLRDGFVRECHGDLHLGNIALVDGALAVFDCIEFSERLRWIDVMSEVAFTAMDLVDRKRPDLAWRYVNRWLEITGDYAGVAVLRFYLAYRAMVRAKVTRLRTAQLAPGTPHGALDAEHMGYVDLARAFASPPRPALVVTHGLSGSGKTAVTQAFVERAGAIRVRTDIERQRLLGVGGAARGGSAIGAGLYTAEATRATYARALALAAAIVQAGHVAVVAGTFRLRAQRDRARETAAKAGVPFAILDFVAPDAMLRARVVARAREGTDASEADLDVLAHQQAAHEPLGDDERAAVVAWDAAAPLGRAREPAAWQALERALGAS
jgi:aminoglycoside phosphotransferase family enzyme/predicted kinase